MSNPWRVFILSLLLCIPSAYADVIAEDDFESGRFKSVWGALTSVKGMRCASSSKVEIAQQIASRRLALTWEGSICSSLLSSIYTYQQTITIDVLEITLITINSFGCGPRLMTI